MKVAAKIILFSDAKAEAVNLSRGIGYESYELSGRKGFKQPQHVSNLFARTRPHNWLREYDETRDKCQSGYVATVNEI
jgi:hypothetical protein